MDLVNLLIYSHLEKLFSNMKIIDMNYPRFKMICFVH